MEQMTVKDLMIPNDAYATVSADGSLREAVLALQEARRQDQQQDPERHRDRAVLVMWQAHIIGKLSMLDVLRGLKPRHARVEGRRASSIGPLIESMTQDFGLRQKPLSRLVEQACKLHVRDLMRPFDETETIDMNASLDTALHQFIAGEYQGLLVKSDDDIVGILRLLDVYEWISKMIIECQTEPKF